MKCFIIRIQCLLIKMRKKRKVFFVDRRTSINPKKSNINERKKEKKGH
jgi:hypothetical protein